MPQGLSTDQKKDGALALGLLLLTFAVFRPCLGFDFISLDDSVYITENPFLPQGFTLSGISWALGTTHGYLWMPVTWLSYLLDYSLFGLNPGPYHAGNVALHSLNAALCFLVLSRATGRRYASLLAAALFALHPLRVESVAWIAERKDVLSGFFFLAGLWAWEAYLRRRSPGRYLAVLGLFILAAGSKPMVVTFPCVLLLWDYWPLGRFGKIGAGDFRKKALALLREKIPLFLVSLLVGLHTIRLQSITAMIPLEELSLAQRLANAAWAYVHYLAMIVRPQNLAVFYPLSSHSALSLGLSWAILLGLLAACFALGRRRAYLPVGFFWFLGMLFPVIGILQAGDQAMADRFTYLPSIGISLALAFGLFDLLSGPRVPKKAGKAALALLSVLIVLVLSFLTLRQEAFWKDSETLYKRTLEVTGENIRINMLLGREYMQKGRFAEAEEVFRRAMAQDSSVEEARANLGSIAYKQGDLEKAEHWFLEELAAHPGSPIAASRLGKLFLEQGDAGNAAEWYGRAMAAAPDEFAVQNGLGAALVSLGRTGEALQYLQKALELAPGNGETNYNLGQLFLREGDRAKAFVHFQKAAEVSPDLAPDANAHLGSLLAEKGKYAEALAFYDRSLAAKPRNAAVLNNKGIAKAVLGDREEAEKLFLRALAVDPESADAQKNLAVLRAAGP